MNHHKYVCQPGYCRAQTLILGCGSTQRGDEGFGSEVIDCLKKYYRMPEGTFLLDCGIAVTEVLLDIALSEIRPQTIILVDTMDRGQPPGTISVIPVNGLARRRTRTGSGHLGPASSLLRELQHSGSVRVTILALEPSHATHYIEPGLLPALEKAVPEACKRILDLIRDGRDEGVYPLTPGRKPAGLVIKGVVIKVKS